jgi:hypothetical protein
MMLVSEIRATVRRLVGEEEIFGREEMEMNQCIPIQGFSTILNGSLIS